MSKITIITASPCQDSNSTQMAKWLKEEAEQKVKALVKKYA